MASEYNRVPGWAALVGVASVALIVARVVHDVPAFNFTAFAFLASFFVSGVLVGRWADAWLWERANADDEEPAAPERKDDR